MKLLIKVGKREFWSVDMVQLIADLSPVKKRSKSEVKRLFKQGAIDILLENGRKS